MNEQLQQALADLINKGVQSAEKAGDFLLSELPGVVQQVMAWNFVWSLIWFCLGVFLIPVVIWANVKIVKKIEIEYWDGSDWFLVCLVDLVFLFPSVLLISKNFDWLKIWLAPKVWLIEYAANLVKQ
jgi:hypothetical protein